MYNSYRDKSCVIITYCISDTFIKLSIDLHSLEYKESESNFLYGGFESLTIGQWIHCAFGSCISTYNKETPELRMYHAGHFDATNSGDLNYNKDGCKIAVMSLDSDGKVEGSTLCDYKGAALNSRNAKVDLWMYPTKVLKVLV